MPIGIGLGLGLTVSSSEGGTAFPIATPLDFAVDDDPAVTNPPTFSVNLVSVGGTAVQADDYCQLEIDGVTYDSEPVTQEQIDGAGFDLVFPDFDEDTPGAGTYDDARLRVVRSLGPDVVSDWTAPLAEFEVPALTDNWALEDDSGSWILEDDSGAWILESN